MLVPTVVLWIAAALLALAGVRKVAAPQATAAALHGARLPAAPALVRALGAGEIVLAVLVLVVGGPLPAAAVALAYVAFAGFAEAQRRKGAGCGCLGEASAPATRLHVGMNLVAAVAAALAVFGTAPPLRATFSGAPMEGIVTAALVATAAAVCSLLLTALPELIAASGLHEEEAA